MEDSTKPAFAIWITGLPSSGKSTLASAIARQLTQAGIEIAVLESDALRRILTPRPIYSEEERDAFYHAMAHVGTLLVRHGVPVIFDATANRRRYRNRARQQIPRFFEVYLDCPLSICAQRDAKGIYRQGKEGGSSTVPGLQAPYEAPEHPELVVHGDRESPEEAAKRIVVALQERNYLDACAPGAEDPALEADGPGNESSR